MCTVDLSLADYQSALADGRFQPPASLCPYCDVDPVLFRQQADTDLRRGDIARALNELRLRTGDEYFTKTHALQARTLDYSSRTFPGYRFMLPEVMTEDWLAVVDWGKFQRDHVLHQPLCGYVMLRLLDGDGAAGSFVLPNGRSLLDTCVEEILKWDGTSYIRDFLLKCGLGEDSQILRNGDIARAVWRLFFREAAYVAAVFHDIGYPWQYAERVQANLDGINAPAVRQCRSAEQIVDSFGQRLFFTALSGYINPNAASPSTWKARITAVVRAALNGTHGLPGALGFLHLNDCIRRFPSETESPLNLLCIEWVATAIMMHDMCKTYWGASRAGVDAPQNPHLRLSFARDPLSSLLTLVDVIQDFERPGAIFATAGRGKKQHVSLGYESSCTGTTLDLRNRSLSIQYGMRTRESLATKRGFVQKESAELFSSQYGFLDMAALGVDSVQLSAHLRTH